MVKVEKQKENIETLLNLIKENQDLRILPMVDSDIVADDGCSWWTASWGSSSIEEIYNHDERCYVRSADEEELAEEFFNEIEIGNPAWSDNLKEQLVEERMKEIKWEKVIAVRINLP